MFDNYNCCNVFDIVKMEAFCNLPFCSQKELDYSGVLLTFSFFGVYMLVFN